MVRHRLARANKLAAPIVRDHDPKLKIGAERYLPRKDRL
jgi:hypothetical protein